MKERYNSYCFIIIFFMLVSGLFAQEKPLAEIYKQGSIRFIKELAISDESLPEGEFFNSVISVAMDDSGAIYACDYEANNIKKFNAEGDFLKIICKEGQGPGEIASPLRIEVVKDRLVVWESGNMRISLLNLEGEFIKSVKWDRGKWGWPYGITSLPDGKLLFETRVSYRRGPSQPEERILHLFSFDIEHEREIYRKDVWSRKNILNPEMQRQQSIPVPFSASVHWDVTPQGNIVIGYSEKYTVELYNPIKGKISSFSKEYEPVEVEKEDKEQYFAGMVFSTSTGNSVQRKQGAPDYVVKNTDFPKYKPAFNDVKCDSEGNIWIHTFHKDKKEEDRFFDAFDKDGRFINRVKIEGDGLYPYYTKIRNRSFCVLEADADGYQKIIKYRITE